MNEHIRPSQALTVYGVGAIAELKEYSGVMKNPNLWVENYVSIKNITDFRNQIIEPRLLKKLRYDIPELKKFVKFPTSDSPGALIPFSIFPRWLFCDRCNKLKPIEEWLIINSNQLNLQCHCGGKLIPSRFVIICKNGHLDDFPYIEWVHKYEACKKNPALKITFGAQGSSLSNITVECECGKKRSMEGAFDPLNHLEYQCEGNLPELSSITGPYKEGCDKKFFGDLDLKDPRQPLRVALRNASNVHFPVIHSAIVIPPYTDSLTTLIQIQPDFTSLVMKNSERQTNNDADLDDRIRNYKENITKDVRKSNCEYESKTIEEKIDLILNPVINENSNLRIEEYDALNSNVDLDNENFVKKNKSVSLYLNTLGIASLVEIKRLKEVRVLSAYTRVQPHLSDDGGEGDKPRKIQIIQKHRFQKNSVDFIPGVEFFGEGIFLTFDHGMLKNFNANNEVESRAKLLKTNYDNNKFGQLNGLPLTSDMVLLHTFAHIVIRKLSFVSGYALASIRERLYCDDLEHGMRGIMIYTVDSDPDGTLGGLCRLADPAKLSEIIKMAIEESYWCASDPVCLESNGQGFGSLNLAACHSCALLPETSCELGNKFLDRKLLHIYKSISDSDS